MPPRKFLKNRCSEIESEGILESKYHIMYINFKSQNIKTSAINMIWRTEGEQLSSHSILIMALTYKLYQITAISQVQFMLIC